MAKYLIYIRFHLFFLQLSLSPTNHNCLNKCLLNQVCIKTKEFNFDKSDESGPEVNFSFFCISCYQVSNAKIYIWCSTGEYYMFLFYVVGHICRFLHKSFEARVAGQRDFNQTTFVNIFYRQHIYVNVTVNLPFTQCIKEGVSVQRNVLDQDCFLKSGMQIPNCWYF